MAADFDINEYLDIIGRVGRYQWMLMFQTGFMVVVFGWSMFMMVFTHSAPNFRCIDDVTTGINTTFPAAPNGVNDSLAQIFDNKCEISTVSDENVTVTRKCTNFEFDKSLFKLTITESFLIICDRQYLTMMTEMIYMAIVGVGTVIGSHLGDRYGRKKVIIGSLILGSAAGAIQAASVNIEMYTVFRTISGMFFFAAFNPAFSLTLETVSAKNRPHVLNALEFYWIFGIASISLFAYLMRTWWHLQLALHLPGVVFGILYIWTMEESPHWLVSQGRHEEALAVLQRIAKFNGQSTEGLSFDIADFETSSTSKLEKERDDKPAESFIQVLKAKRVVARFFVFSYAWIVCSMCYYALSFGIRSLPGDIFVNNLISACAEAIGYACCFCIAWWGRKWPTVAAFYCAGAALFVSVMISAYIPDKLMVITIMSMIGKLFIVAAWQIIIVWSGEIFPTTQRCMLSSVVTLMGRIGGVLAPVCLDLHKLINLPKEELIMPIIFVVFMVIGGFLHMIPPETNRRRLPEFIHEANVAEFPYDDGKSHNKNTSTNGEPAVDEAERHDLLDDEKFNS